MFRLFLIPYFIILYAIATILVVLSAVSSGFEIVPTSLVIFVIAIVPIAISVLILCPLIGRPGLGGAVLGVVACVLQPLVLVSLFIIVFGVIEGENPLPSIGMLVLYVAQWVSSGFQGITDVPNGIVPSCTVIFIGSLFAPILGAWLRDDFP